MEEVLRKKSQLYIDTPGPEFIGIDKKIANFEEWDGSSSLLAQFLTQLKNFFEM